MKLVKERLEPDWKDLDFVPKGGREALETGEVEQRTEQGRTMYFFRWHMAGEREAVSKVKTASRCKNGQEDLNIVVWLNR
eukprot:2240119-Amphidinium_carterae.1